MSDNNISATVSTSGAGGISSSVGGLDEALMLISDALLELRKEANRSSAVGLSFDKARNLAIFNLTGQISSTLATGEDRKKVLPWMENESELEKIRDIRLSAEMGIEFLEANGENYTVPEDTGEEI